MIELVRFLCTIDDLTIELLDATLNGQARSAAEIGRAIGVTRQAVHRKLVDECCRHQELVGFFGLHLKRCRRILEKRKAREAKSRRRKKGLDQ